MPVPVKLALGNRLLNERGANLLEQPHLVPDRQRLLVRHRQGKRLRQRCHRLQVALLAVCLSLSPGRRGGRQVVHEGHEVQPVVQEPLTLEDALDQYGQRRLRLATQG